MEPDFEFILYGEELDWYQKGRDLEVQVAFPLFRRIQVGRVIKLYKPKEAGVLRRRVQAIRRYHSFRGMLEKEVITRIAPGIEDKQILLRSLREIWPTHAERQGVLVLELVKVA